mmetsp:Transcript_10817/g.22705  ORF Transcript_10817/g.22705 Transcript_10817/m.22705 type:complete len:215 (-) Transcript_10817:572-1216(-)
MKSVALVLAATTVASTSAASCFPNATHGCLNGYPYDYDTQFPCGSMDEEGNQPIFSWATSGCCAQGLSFDSSDSYCCFDGVHTYSEGECISWDSKSFNTNCYCDGAKEGYGEHLVMPTGRKPVSDDIPDTIDTSAVNEDPCDTADETNGCLNGWPYNFKEQYPCSHYINRYDTMGCCSDTPYNLDEDSCCKEGDNYVVHSADAHACDCSKYGCQ